MDKILKRSWVEIDIAQIKKNYCIYKSRLPGEMDVMAVIKADAYGHGDVEIAEALMHEGVKHWAVSNVNEACKLRKSGCQGQILVLGYTPIEQLELIEAYDITQALISEEYAQAVLSTGIRIKCQFAIDTGMKRIGLDAVDADECERIIRYYAERLNVTGLFTHLCVADDNSEASITFTKKQLKQFETVVCSVDDLNLKYIHCLNSAGGLSYEAKYSNLVRLGIILYGLKPDYSNQLPDGIKTAMVWKSVVSMIKKIHIGETIGYARTFVAKKDMCVATIPTGYADGYNRQLSNQGVVFINGKKANIVGRICMDQFMVDVSDITDVKAGDEVILLNDSYSADDMANMIGTIGYEIVCNISKRVDRVYI